MAPVGKRPYDSTGFRLGEFDAEESNHSGRGGRCPRGKAIRKFPDPRRRVPPCARAFYLCYAGSTRPASSLSLSHAFEIATMRGLMQ